MYTYTLKKLPKNTAEILVDIPQATVQEEYKKALSRLQKDLEVKGFRKGKVPEDVAVKNLKKEQIYEELIRSFLPQIYKEIIDKEQLKPIISPKIELVQAKEAEEWQVKITVAEKPLIK